jgi:hypothetical protein
MTSSYHLRPTTSRQTHAVDTFIDTYYRFVVKLASISQNNRLNNYAEILNSIREIKQLIPKLQKAHKEADRSTFTSNELRLELNKKLQYIQSETIQLWEIELQLTTYRHISHMIDNALMKEDWVSFCTLFNQIVYDMWAFNLKYKNSGIYDLPNAKELITKCEGFE